MSKPDIQGSEKELVFPTDEQMQKSVEAFLETLDVGLLSDFVDAHLTVPGEPGLYALIAPDGVMAKVVEATMDGKEIRHLIMRDIVGRFLREFYRECLDRHMSVEQITNATFFKLVAAKKLYRLEKLSG